MRRACSLLVLGAALVAGCAHTRPVARPGDVVRVTLGAGDKAIVGRAIAVDPDRLSMLPEGESTSRTFDRATATMLEIDRIARQRWHRPFFCGAMVLNPLIALTSLPLHGKQLALNALMFTMHARDCVRPHNWTPAVFPAAAPGSGAP
ncbi:MAG: hypothetical protein ABR559_04775 [Gemmatimonadota bacterium]